MDSTNGREVGSVRGGGTRDDGGDECEGAERDAYADPGPSGTGGRRAFLHTGGLTDAVAEGRQGAGMVVLLDSADASSRDALDAVCTDRVADAAASNSVVAVRLAHGSVAMEQFLAYCPVADILDGNAETNQRSNESGRGPAIPTCIVVVNRHGRVAGVLVHMQPDGNSTGGDEARHASATVSDSDSTVAELSEDELVRRIEGLGAALTRQREVQLIAALAAAANTQQQQQQQQQQLQQQQQQQRQQQQQQRVNIANENAVQQHHQRPATSSAAGASAFRGGPHYATDDDRQSVEALFHVSPRAPSSRGLYQQQQQQRRQFTQPSSRMGNMPPPSEQPTTSGVTVAGGIERHAHVVQQPVRNVNQYVQQPPPQQQQQQQQQQHHVHVAQAADEEESEAIYAESACTSTGMPAPSRRSHRPPQPTMTNRSIRTEDDSRMGGMHASTWQHHAQQTVQQTVQQEAVSPIKLAQPVRSSSANNIIQLHIRLPDGQSLFSTFEDTSPLSAVVNFIDTNRTDEAQPYTLSVAYPRRELVSGGGNHVDMARLGMSLKELELATRITLLVTPVAAAVAAAAGGTANPSSSTGAGTLLNGIGQVLEYVNPMNLLGVTRSGEVPAAEHNSDEDEDGDSIMTHHGVRQEQVLRRSQRRGRPTNVATLSSLASEPVESERNEYYNGNSIAFSGEDKEPPRSHSLTDEECT